MPSSPDRLKTGDDIAGRYVIESRLGEGGVATVFRVRDRRGRPFALKIVVAPADHVAARFLQEARVQATLPSDHIVRVHEVIELPRMLGMVLDLVEGPTLEQLLEHSGPLGPAHADLLALGMFRGLDAAHAADVVHRDFKPSNVLVAIDGSRRPVPRVTDFGVAKITTGATLGHSLTGMFVGTVAYMAPEQARDGRHVDARADVYALGAVLYRMVTGVPPFSGAGLWDVFEAVQSGTYTPAEERVPGLPERQARAIREALRPDPATRPASVAALADLWFDRADALSTARPEPTSWPGDWLAPPPTLGFTLDADRSVTPVVPHFERDGTPRRRRWRLPKGVVPAALVAGALAVVVGLTASRPPVPAPQVRVGPADVGATVTLIDDADVPTTLGVTPARVHAGTYTLRATFADGVPSPAGTLELAPGDDVLVTCDPTTRSCRR